MPPSWVQAFLSVAPIPSCLLSIAGSSLIIQHVRKGKRMSSYRSILTAMSVCDIIFTCGWMLQPFLSPSTIDQPWIFAVGNAGTCTFLGFVSQFGMSAHCYAALLSFYFVLTVRFGVTQATFTKVLPFFHGLIMIWSIGTAIAGTVLGQFNEMGVSPGCWIGGDGCVEDCMTPYILGWIFGGVPTLFCLGCVVVNNLVLYCYVRQTVVTGQRRSMEAEMKLAKYGSRPSSVVSGNQQSLSVEMPQNCRELPFSSDDAKSMLSHSDDFSLVSADSPSVTNTDDGRESQASFVSRSFGKIRTSAQSDSGSVSLASNTNRGSILRSSDKQWKRVQEVGTQSFLYVGAYFLSFVWSLSINILDGSNIEFREDAAYFFLPLLILQSILLPTMGFTSACIYFRPKILANSREFPAESRIWWAKRAIFGDSIKPTKARASRTGRFSGPTSKQPHQEPPKTLRIPSWRPTAMSSLVKKDSDVDGEGEGSRDSMRLTIIGDDCSVIAEGEFEESSRLALSLRHSISENKSESIHEVQKELPKSESIQEECNNTDRTESST